MMLGALAADRHRVPDLAKSLQHGEESVSPYLNFIVCRVSEFVVRYVQVRCTLERL